jgi:flagellar biosynthetic protein FliR
VEILKALDQLLVQLGLGTDVTGFLIVFGLALSRVIGAILLNPFLGGGAIAGRIKIGLAIVITAVLFPSVSPGVTKVQVGNITFVGLVAKEVTIGITIGLISQLIFYTVQMAGTLIDTQRGMNQATFFSPQLQGNVSLIGQLQFQAALVLFLSLNGHLLFLRALHNSFQQVGILEFPRFQMGVPAVTEQIMRLSAATFVVAIQLSAPVLLVLFLVDVAFGALNKIAPQINVHNESQPVKAFVGLLIVILTIGFVMARLDRQFAQMIQDLYNVSRLFA